MIPLGEMMVSRPGSLKPSQHPEENFDLYSIPAYDQGSWEIAAGGVIGSAKQFVKPGDVLLSKIVPHIRRAAIVGPRNGRRQIASGEWVIFRSPTVDPRYLRHFFLSDQFHIRFMNTVAGIGGSLLRARPQFVKNIPIPLPPLDEQRRVAAILDQADAIRAKRQQQLAALDSLSQSLFIDMFGDPERWADRWDMGTIADLVETTQYGTSKRADIRGALPILRMGNVSDDGRISTDDLKFIDLDESEVAKYITRRGDLLFNRTNSLDHVGKSAVVKTDEVFAIAGYLIRVRLKPEHSPEFVAAFLNSSYGKLLRRNIAKAAVNQANINAQELRRIRIAIPPQNVQRTFAHRLGSVELQRKKIHRALDRDNELFASLQSRAFRGEL